MFEITLLTARVVFVFLIVDSFAWDDDLLPLTDWSIWLDSDLAPLPMEYPSLTNTSYVIRGYCRQLYCITACDHIPLKEEHLFAAIVCANPNQMAIVSPEQHRDLLEKYVVHWKESEINEKAS